MTEEVKNQYIIQWTSQILSWENRARAYIAQNSALIKKLKTGYNTLLETQNMLKAKRVAQEQIKNVNLLRDGYVLLNQIGETIRGEKIVYSITFTQTGEKISSMPQGVYTWRMDLSEVLNLFSYSRTRIVLKSPTTLYNMMQTQIDEQTNIDYEKWSEEKIQNYAIFNKNARSVKRGTVKGYYKKINEGNMLEAYLRHLENAYAIDDFHMLHRTLIQTFLNTSKFFQGGDINNEQIKGLNASITNLNSLLLNLHDTLKILAQTKAGREVIEPQVKKNFINQFQETLLLDEEKAVDKLVEKFTTQMNIIL